MAGLLGVSAIGASIGLFDHFKVQATDVLHPVGTLDPDLVVVGIDRPSTDEIGAWPWPRSVHAELVRSLSAAGVRLIVYDVAFTSPTNDDEDLRRALGDAENTVLTVSARRPRAQPTGLLRADVQPPPSPLSEAALAAGHPAVLPHPRDGVVRSLPLLLESAEGNFVPALSLAAFAELESVTSVPTLRPDGVQIGQTFVPTEEEAAMRIAFPSDLRPGADPPVISAAEVLEGAPPDLAGKIALVGRTDPLGGDAGFMTPVDKGGSTPGVLVHTAALNTLLTGTHLVPASTAETMLWVVALTALVVVLALFGPVWISAVVAVAVSFGYLVLTATRFGGGVAMDPLYPPAAVLVGFVAALGVDYVTESRRRRRLMGLFSQYVPAAVARDLVAGGRMDEITSGSRKEISVLFCDLRGFTPLVARLSPVVVRDLLNVYYQQAAEVIFAHGGTLMQYVGDEVFAVFGAPGDDPDHAGSALGCAAALRDEVTSLSRRLEELDIPPVAYGIGVHSGEAVTAEVGNERRRQYAAVGDMVNVGSRICSAAGAGEVLFTDAVHRRLGAEPEANLVPGVELKGVTAEVQVYRLGSSTRLGTSPP